MTKREQKPKNKAFKNFKKAQCPKKMPFASKKMRKNYDKIRKNYDKMSKKAL